MCPVAAELNFAGADRYTVYFKVFDSKWPEVKKRLEGLLTR